MMSDDSDKLRRENAGLKTAIKRLTIEKNKLEDQLYRAFWKCLNSKKRKIAELERELGRLKQADGNNKRPKVTTTKRNNRRKVVAAATTISSSSSSEEGESGWKKEYEDDSETDLDDNKLVMDCGDDQTAPGNAANNNTATATAAVIEKENNSATESESSQGLSFPFPKDFEIMKTRKEQDSFSEGQKDEGGGGGRAKTVDEETTVVGDHRNSQESTTSTCYDLDELINDL